MEDHHQIHIVVFAFPFGSHGTPLLNIVRQLTSLTPKNNLLHFSFFSSSNSIDSLFPQGPETYHNIRPYKICHANVGIDQFFGDALREGALMAAVRKVEEEVGIKVKCVMGDAFLWFLGNLRKEIDVVWVCCWVSGEHALSLHLYTDVIRQRFGTQGIEDKEEETLNFIPGLSKIRLKDMQDGIITNCDSPFAQMLHKMSEVITNANAVCISSCEELDPIVTNDLKSKFSKLFTIGPLNLVLAPTKAPDTYNCLTWLDQQKTNSVVYVSFGSAATPTPNELFALAEALLDSGVHFLWSIKDHLKVHFPTEFLEKTREKGMVVPWVPQIDVLAHDAVGVFITHFGYNSMTESIAVEVPMIGRPFFGDHSLNGRLVEAVWEIGLQVDGGVFTKEGVMKSLDLILSSDKGRKMRENIKSINKLVGQAVAPNGSSNNNFRLLLDFIMKA